MLWLGRCLLWRHFRLGVRASGDAFRRGLCQATSARAARCATARGWRRCDRLALHFGVHHIQKGEETKRAGPQGFNPMVTSIFFSWQVAEGTAGRGSCWAGSGWIGALTAFCSKAQGVRQAAAPAGAPIMGQRVACGRPGDVSSGRRFPGAPAPAWVLLSLFWLARPAGALHALRARRGPFVMARCPWVRFGGGYVRRLQVRRTGGSAFLAAAGTAQRSFGACAARALAHPAVSLSSAQEAAAGPRFLQPVPPVFGVGPVQAPRVGASRPAPTNCAAPSSQSSIGSLTPPALFARPGFRGCPALLLFNNSPCDRGRVRTPRRSHRVGSWGGFGRP